MLYIFDWDGTLSDSAEKIIRCMQRAAMDSSLDVLDDDTIKNIIGLGLPEAIKTLYPDIAASDLDNYRSHYVEHFIKDDQQPSPLFPGVLETLESLREKGHTLTVATGKSRRGLDRVLKNLSMENFFHSSRCADETASKPDPLMLKELLIEFSADPQDAVMIGDTEYDMAMAHSLGMKKIAVSYGAHHISRLQAYDPDLCVHEFEQILQW
ncbi:HAD-IIIA family hydrolase [Agarilytica rhodophyticola]|uniref:HAD-IIIA family hydrolase n=1 Tax=Agarilytica rhodophyticola TaxID=1737490 RepID=UPI000B348858|nr:HAD-IIIA family hydrolase [Agarilytica rhodophyticola]